VREDQLRIANLHEWTAWLSEGPAVEALCWGWVDVQTRSVDAEQYEIRFRRRKAGSNWSTTNRRIVCQLLAENRMKPAGRELLPDDLVCD
jgi:hypothetical protein